MTQGNENRTVNETIGAETTHAGTPVGDIPDDLSSTRVQALKEEIARRSISLQALESLAQELPYSGYTEDSMLHTDLVSLANGNDHGDSVTDLVTPDTPTLDPKYSRNNRDSFMSKSSRDSTYESSAFINQFIQKGLSDSVGSNTSKVIAGLQNTIDTLRRELKDQNAKYIEAKRGRDALSKRCDHQSESMESLRHQNEMLNTMMLRRERQMHEVESKLAIEKSRAQRLEKQHSDNEAHLIDMEERTAMAEDRYNQLQTAADASADGYRRKEEFLKREFQQLQESISEISAGQSQWRQSVLQKLTREEELRDLIRQHQLEFEKLATQREEKMQEMLDQLKSGVQNHGDTIDKMMERLEKLSVETRRSLEMLQKSQHELSEENDRLKLTK